VIRNQRRSLRLTAALAAGAFVLSACSSGSGSTAAKAGASGSGSVDLSGLTLKVGIFQTVTEDQAAASGAFKNTPYKIQWAVLNGAAPTVEALQAQAIDLSWGLSDTATPLGAAQAKSPWTSTSAPFKIVALLKPNDPVTYPGSIIAAHKNTGINTLADLRGKTYAYNEGGNANAIALLALYHAGLTKADVKVTVLQSNSLAPAVSSGAVDAASVGISGVAAQLEAGTVKQIATAHQVGFPGYVTVTARTGALNDPRLSAAIGDFVQRVAKFQKWGAANLTAIAKTYETNQQLTPTQAELSAHNAAETVVPVAPQDPDAKAEVALTGLLYKAQFLPKPIDEAPFLDGRYSAQIAAGNAG
jgi:sulfonate transport system substrate-binding protein